MTRVERLETGGKHLALGIPDLQPGVGEHGGPGGIAELDAQRVGRDLRLQPAPHGEGEGEREILIRSSRREEALTAFFGRDWSLVTSAATRCFTPGPLLHDEAVLQSARVIHPPLLHGRIPVVGEPLSVGLHRRHAVDIPHRAGEAVAREFQPPLPAAALRLGHEPVPVELRGPLLPRIARLPSARDGLEGMTPRLIRRADALPVGPGQPVGHLIGRGELLGLARRRGRARGRGDEQEGKEEQEGGEVRLHGGCSGWL